MCLERPRRLFQIRDQHRQFGDLATCGEQLRGDDGLQPVLQRCALSAIPRSVEIIDLVEAAAELLGAGDECQPVEAAIVVQTVARCGTRRRGQ